MNDRQLMQQALDALESASAIMDGDAHKRQESAISALRARLAQPEPASRIVECARRLVEHADFHLGGVLSDKSKAKDIPSNAQSTVKARHLAALRDALYTTPPARQWVDLTDEQIARIASTPCAVVGSYVHTFARAISAALRQKNGGTE